MNNSFNQRLRIMMVLSTGLNRTMVDEIVYEIPNVDYIVVDDNRSAIYGAIREGVTGLIGCPRTLMTPELIVLAGSSLRWIHVPGAGCEDFFFKQLVESPIVLTNGRIIQGPEVADHAFALLLALTRNLHYYLSGRVDSLPRPIELRSKTAVVIGGGGGIGLLIGERAAAFGMDVIAVDDDYVHLASFIREYYTFDRYLQALPRGDVVFMAAPVTRRSRGMMNAAAFMAMKYGAFFVNISRGKTVVTPDLLDALEAGKLAGAGLDVTDPEPLPPDHPLRIMKNVVLTPHVAGLSDHNRQRSFELIKQNIKRFVDNLPLINVVDKQREY